jgi:ABC-2 type transport system ATP-binding protein
LADLCDSVTILDRGAVKYTGSMKGLLKSTTSEQEHQNFRLTMAKSSGELVETLRSTEGVVEISESESEENTYKIALDLEVCSTNKLLGIVIGQEVEVIEFKEDLKHLNEAFMNLTEAGVREK